MASPRLRGVLLCEDKEHERFFRRLLEEKWFGRGKVRVNRIPDRKGAGDAYVLANYAREVQYARSKQSENYALVVAIDGDREKIHGRLKQLERRLTDAGLPQRAGDELIAICIPTRSIETWELWLCGARNLDEELDCKGRLREAEGRGVASPKLAVKGWFVPLSDGEKQLEEETLPALSASRAEIRRLDR